MTRKLAFCFIALTGLFWLYWIAATKSIHPDPARIPSVADIQPPSFLDAKVGQARQLIRSHLADRNVPGLSLGLAKNGELVWAEGFGYSDLKSGELVTSTHRFRLGSASTLITKVILNQLIEEGLLNLHSEIQDYVPAFPKKQWPLTLSHLVSSQSGLSSEETNRNGSLFTKHCQNSAEAVAFFSQHPLLFQPGSRQIASVYDWILLSAAMEAVSKQPLQSLLEGHLLNPLKLQHTGLESRSITDHDPPPVNLFRELIFDPRTTLKSLSGRPPQRITYYFPRFARNSRYGLHEMRPLDLSCYAGSAAIESTPSDLIRVAAMLGDKLNTHTTGELLGGTVATIRFSPAQKWIIAVVSNIPHEATATLAMQLEALFTN